MLLRGEADVFRNILRVRVRCNILSHWSLFENAKVITKMLFISVSWKPVAVELLFHKLFVGTRLKLVI